MHRSETLPVIILLMESLNIFYFDGLFHEMMDVERSLTLLLHGDTNINYKPVGSWDRTSTLVITISLVSSQLPTYDLWIQSWLTIMGSNNNLRTREIQFLFKCLMSPACQIIDKYFMKVS